MTAKITKIGKTTLRLDESVMKAAEIIARLEGVTVTELVEILIFRFAYRETVDEPLGGAAPEAPAAQPTLPPPLPMRPRSRGRVIDLVAERERRHPGSALPIEVSPVPMTEPVSAPVEACASDDQAVLAPTRDRCVAMRRHAAEAVARSVAARDESRRALARAVETRERTAWVWTSRGEQGAWDYLCAEQGNITSR
jgi:hypothetical protein